jgi:alpha-N-arabinofuranosidase
MEHSSRQMISRRDAIKKMVGTAGALSLGGPLLAQTTESRSLTIQVDPTPRYELSPYLFMQFMEPLGATDGSVEAAWDHQQRAWRRDLIDVTRQLGPTMMRWGGCFSSYYRWREAVGPRDQRQVMYNLLWGGIESNQIGTAEFVDFCRQVRADPLMCVNFECDGRKPWMTDPAGRSRFADAQEAAAWVRYCNDPDDALRIRHGFKQPHTIKLWQIGNETSYDKNGFDALTAAQKTVEFAKAMRKADPAVQLIGWGDRGFWSRMLEIAGEHLQYIAFHHMFDPDDRKKPVLRGDLFRRDPDAAWNQLMQAWKINDQTIRQARESVGRYKSPLAMTECHFSVPGQDRCDVMSTWAVGAAYARMFNNYQRHGDVLKIATAADFCGNRWQVNAVMLFTPYPQKHVTCYLMPVARVMQLYRHHIGSHAVSVESQNSDLDVVASRRDRTVYLHVVNTHRTRSVTASFGIKGAAVQQADMYVIAEDTAAELTYLNADRLMQISKKSLAPNGAWEFPAASVSAVEITMA